MDQGEYQYQTPLPNFEHATRGEIMRRDPGNTAVRRIANLLLTSNPFSRLMKWTAVRVGLNCVLQSTDDVRDNYAPLFLRAVIPRLKSKQMFKIKFHPGSMSKSPFIFCLNLIFRFRMRRWRERLRHGPTWKHASTSSLHQHHRSVATQSSFKTLRHSKHIFRDYLWAKKYSKTLSISIWSSVTQFRAKQGSEAVRPKFVYNWKEPAAALTLRCSSSSKRFALQSGESISNALTHLCKTGGSCFVFKAL